VLLRTPITQVRRHIKDDLNVKVFKNKLYDIASFGLEVYEYLVGPEVFFFCVGFGARSLRKHDFR
jgi:ribosomal protein L10